MSAAARLRVGVLGTSWWTDSMYLPAIDAHPGADVVGLCGRRRDAADSLAATWSVPWTSVDPDEFLDPERLDAVVVATSNDSHEPLTLTAIDRGLHVLCEKPTATTATGAWRMADRAAAAGSITLVPFTYRYMPVFQFVRRLIDGGDVGTIRHLNLRYYTGFAREPGYQWRFDTGVAGSGVLGDLGSHWLHVARWLAGEVVAIGCVSARFVARPARPDGSEYERGEDSAVMTVRFENGAYGSLQVCAASHEGGDFGQTHHLDLHGSDASVYAFSDWTTTQEVRLVRADETGPARLVEIPDDVWGACRRGRVHDTYRDVFRVEQRMIGDWIDAVRAGRPVGGPLAPDLAEGARVQDLLELAAASARRDGRLLDAPPRRP